MSHDIRTSINGIVGMTAIAIKNFDDREKMLDCLKKVDTSSRYLMSLVNDILDISRIESGKMSVNHEQIDTVLKGKFCYSLPEHLKFSDLKFSV